MHQLQNKQHKQHNTKTSKSSLTSTKIAFSNITRAIRDYVMLLVQTQQRVGELASDDDNDAYTIKIDEP
jgi:hypothetical protein